MSIIANYTQAARVSRRSVTAILLEALRLRFSHYRLGLSEYIDFQLYLNDLTYSEKETFGGARTQAMLEEILIDDYSRFLSLDKVTMYSVLRGHSLPVPVVRATYRCLRPRSIHSMQSAADLEQYLKSPGHLPVYIKRSFGSYGRGNILVQRIHENNVVLGNGVSEPITDFCKSLDEARSLGWILQEPLKSHAEIRNLTQSDKISGLRIHTFFSGASPTITKAIFKINVGVRDSDNFEHGASGNMLAAVDMATGKVTRVVSGVGLKQVWNPAHPRTGAKILGFQIPYWNEVLTLVKDAQTAFPGFICPGWDIAICDDGPKILEVNAFGDMDLSQHAYRTGFLDTDFLSLMRDRELERLLYVRPGQSSKSKVNNRLGLRKHHWLW